MRTPLLLTPFAALLFSLAAVAAPPASTGRSTVVETEVDLETQDPARAVAETYLKAISGQANDLGLDLLLGGATLTARIFLIENWKIVGREKHQREEGALQEVQKAMRSVDTAGRDAMAKMMRGDARADPDGLTALEITEVEASRLLDPTRVKAKRLADAFPVFSYVARVDKQVFWHPRNPVRKLLADAGRSGTYALDFDLFWVETVEGRGDSLRTRKWPLRVVRFKSSLVDTGLKVLPASDWNGE